MINVETILFIETMRDLAKQTRYGYLPYSKLSGTPTKKIVYDDDFDGESGYPILLVWKRGEVIDTYDTEDSTFRVYECEDGDHYIIASVADSEDRFMIRDGEWFSI